MARNVRNQAIGAMTIATAKITQVRISRSGSIGAAVYDAQRASSADCRARRPEETKTGVRQVRCNGLLAAGVRRSGGNAKSVSERTAPAQAVEETEKSLAGPDASLPTGNPNCSGFRWRGASMKKRPAPEVSDVARATRPLSWRSPPGGALRTAPSRSATAAHLSWATGAWRSEAGE